MTQQEIYDCQQMAIFDGWVCKKGSWYHDRYRFDDHHRTGDKIPMSDGILNQYHTSFELVMSCVGNIRRVCDSMLLTISETHTKLEADIDTGTDKNEGFKYEKEGYGLEVMREAVIEFIKWYKNNQRIGGKKNG